MKRKQAIKATITKSAKKPLGERYAELLQLRRILESQTSNLRAPKGAARAPTALN